MAGDDLLSPMIETFVIACLEARSAVSGSGYRLSHLRGSGPESPGRHNQEADRCRTGALLDHVVGPCNVDPKAERDQHV